MVFTKYSYFKNKNRSQYHLCSVAPMEKHMNIALIDQSR